jgi:RNA polymerase sigma-70 factor (ECF subfamily)
MSAESQPQSPRRLTTAPASAAASTPDDVEHERHLVERLRAGDEAAFEEMVRQYSGRLLAVARRLLRRDDDAQDALQDGFVSAFRALPTFRGDCRLSTWLHRIVVNAALMKMRSRRRFPEVPIDELLPAFQADGHHVNTFRPWTDIERALAVEETRVRVRAAIDRLPPAYRTVLLLRDIEELDTEQVASILGTTTNAVKIRLHRARQALLTLLTPTLDAGVETGSSGTAAVTGRRRRTAVAVRSDAAEDASGRGGPVDFVWAAVPA